MKANIEVRSREEGNAIRAGLEDPALRTIALIKGALRTLETDNLRKRVVRYILDDLTEEGLLQRAEVVEHEARIIGSNGP